MLRALRLYGLADDNTSFRDLKKLEVDDQESFLTATLTLDKKRYGLLFGSQIDEEEVDEFWPDLPDTAEMLKNPLDEASFTTPFQGKFLILFNLPTGKERLDIHLASQFDKSISRSLWQKYIQAGCVKVNGKVVKLPKTEILETDSIEVSFPEKAVTSHNIEVIYEDNDVLVINKPSGLLTHAKGGIADEMTVADFLNDKVDFPKKHNRPGIVHRLDRDTSGLLVAARNEATASFLQKQFAGRSVKKVYLAVVEGRPKLDEAKIDLPIARHPKKPSSFRVDPSGKPAETKYKVLATDDARSLVWLEPKTGRTHQLRVHMAHIGTPILGDRVYGQAEERLILHAYQLEIDLPSGERRLFTAKLPEIFSQYFPEIKL